MKVNHSKTENSGPLYLRVLVLIWLSFGFVSGYAQADSALTYLHIGHPRLDGPFAVQLVDPILENLDYTPYEGVFLGGDLTTNTSWYYSTLLYLTQIFDLDKISTLWSLGNHDINNIWNVQQITQRPLFYAWHHEGVTFLVLFTDDDSCSMTGNQMDLVTSVVDTISTSSHLVILHHKLIWMEGNPVLQPMADSVSNGMRGNCGYCLNPNNFYADVYPLLVDVQRRGVDVVLIAGDIGKKVKKFSYQTQDSIWFLASGIEAGDTGNLLLKLTYHKYDRILDWAFVPIEEVAGIQNLPTGGSVFWDRGDKNAVVKVWPNPVSDRVYFWVEKIPDAQILNWPSSQSELVIFDFQGQELQRFPFGSSRFLSLDVGDLASGMYHWVLSRDGEISCRGKLNVVH